MMREWVTRPISRAGILCCLVASAVAAAAATATVSNFIPFGVSARRSSHQRIQFLALSNSMLTLQRTSVTANSKKP
jgi:hypothetical protein